MWIGPVEATVSPCGSRTSDPAVRSSLVQMLRVWIEIAGALRYVRLIFWILTQFVRELFRPKGIKNESIVGPFSEVQLQT